MTAGRASSSAVRQAVVLAGGRGSRLGSLTDETPKPLLVVGGRPFIEWVLANLARHGVTDVVLTVGYKAEAFERWLAGWEGAPRVETFVEDTPLDTGGALALLVDRLDDRFFVLNGDTLIDVPFGGLGRLLSDEGGDAAIALRSVSDTGRYGRVTLANDVVTAFAEKGSRGPGLINGGVYLLRRSALTSLSAPFSIEKDLLPGLCDEGRVMGLPTDGFFIDIGIPQSFEEAQTSVPDWWRSRRGATP